MRARTLSAIGVALIATVAARADIPPPPDDYSGPASATVAGLTFSHQQLQRRTYLRDWGEDPNPFDRGGTFVILTGCTTGHPNCARATKLGVIGGIVKAVDGSDPDADVAAVEKAFTAATKTVTLTLDVDEQLAGGARTLKTVTLTVRPR